MDDLITFIDSFALDEKLFWQLKHGASDTKYELTWTRDHGTADRWRVREVGEQDWDSILSKDLPSKLEEIGIDLEHAKSQLGASIITQAVFASLVVEAAEKLFGRSTLEQAFTNTNQFLVKVLKATQKEVKPKLKIVHSDD